MPPTESFRLLRRWALQSLGNGGRYRISCKGGRQVGFVDRRGQAAQRQESLGLSTESTRYCSSCGHLIETDSPRQMSTYLHSDHNLARANLEIR